MPEPDTIALLAMAAAGIILGRRWAARHPPKD
ncbi:MAG: PEP-CTERM sorting domain-containing protein [Novosphingobium sp.]|nr:PEP-CTERM sorting domain-containing protein [Novosphingobium sp.]